MKFYSLFQVGFGILNPGFGKSADWGETEMKAN